MKGQERVPLNSTLPFNGYADESPGALPFDDDPQCDDCNGEPFADGGLCGHCWGGLS